MREVREEIEAILAADVKLVGSRVAERNCELALEDARKLCMVYDALLRGESLDRKATDDDLGELSDEELVAKAAAMQEKLRGKK